jgi:hypothetical protein
MGWLWVGIEMQKKMIRTPFMPVSSKKKGAEEKWVSGNS